MNRQLFTPRIDTAFIENIGNDSHELIRLDFVRLSNGVAHLHNTIKNIHWTQSTFNLMESLVQICILPQTYIQSLWSPLIDSNFFSNHIYPLIFSLSTKTKIKKCIFFKITLLYLNLNLCLFYILVMHFLQRFFI